ncbi:MAG: PAS domain S-box protein [Gemmatimonadales bacterium]|nr:MAG: PAS domain S-box protein [Gemmatimonadales bacterium]
MTPDFPIVGIGASAGGLAALADFFSGIPPEQDPGMAFVVVQHLSPDHESVLPDLVGRQTRLRVLQAEDGMEVERNCVYVIPPNRDISLSDGRLHLTDPHGPRGQRLPIDSFFRSLARDQQGRAVGVILSGTGSDGTLGLRMIKGEGGMAMVQDPETAEHSGMPRSAVRTGLVDFVLPPAEMPAQLMAYVRSALAEGSGSHGPETSRPEAPSGSPDAWQMLFSEIRDRTGHDFSHYKDSTVHRRLKRRMAVQQVDRLEDYVRFLKSSPEEVDALFQDLLIGVTRFFRDPQAFQALGNAVSEIIAGKSPGAPIRVWVPGCSTGEEAYSIAILLREEMEAMECSLPVQIFATDIDPRAIEVARAGLYPASIAPDLPDQELARFFVSDKTDETAFRIREDIRDMLVFSEQNVLSDPPFSKLDLISCRNLLIYLDQDLQKQLIPLFHYALNPDGLLFLGTSESVGDATDLFEALDRRMSLYRRREMSQDQMRPTTGPFGRPRRKTRSARRPPDEKRPPGGPPLPLRRITETALLTETAPVAALVDESGKILYLHGRTGLYLEPAPGEGEMNVLRMAREGLQRDLSIAFHRATTRQERVQRDGLKVRTNGDSVMVDLVVRPVPRGPGVNEDSQDQQGSPLFLIILKAVQDDASAGPAPGVSLGTDKSELERRIVELEEKLEASEGYLGATQEEMQSTNEELRTSIEELQSANEELQATNEELETSQEELQSLNEELATVNTELESKVSDLSRSRNDMDNLLAGTGIATIFVDEELRIQRFTPTATRLMNLIKADRGRPVGDLASKLVNYDSLTDDIHGVLDTLEAREREVQTKDGQWYLLGIRPYRTLGNVIEGAVVTFVQISELKKAQAAIREAEGLRRLAVVVRDSSDPISSVDLEGRIQAWNPAAERIYGWSEADALQMNYLDLVPESLQAEARSIFESARSGLEIEPFRTDRLTRHDQTVTVWLTVTGLVDEEGRPYGVSSTERPLPPQSREEG